jgi:hypothetical protein
MKCSRAIRANKVGLGHGDRHGPVTGSRRSSAGPGFRPTSRIRVSIVQCLLCQWLPGPQAQGPASLTRSCQHGPGPVTVASAAAQAAARGRRGGTGTAIADGGRQPFHKKKNGIRAITPRPLQILIRFEWPLTRFESEQQI